MGYSALPTIAECCNCLGDLRTASTIISYFTTIYPILLYRVLDWIGFKYAGKYVVCDLPYPSVGSVIQIINLVILIVASGFLNFGAKYENIRFVHGYVVAVLWAFTIEVALGFYYLYFVITNLRWCYEYGGLIFACLALIRPIILLYCAAVVNSYYQELLLPPFYKKQKKTDDEDDKK